MHHPFPAFVLLGLLPLAYFARRFGLLERRAVRWTLAALGVAALAASAYVGGVDFEILKRMKLGIALLVIAGLVVTDRAGTPLPAPPGSPAPGRGPAPPDAIGAPLPGQAEAAPPARAPLARPWRPSRLAWLTALAIVAWVIHLNFFSFHGARTFVHLHDVAHYYLGSKYFAELGYGDIYIGMLRAEAELSDNHFKSIEARDLRTNALVHIRPLLRDSDRVKARFTPERWADFQLDVAYFLRGMGKQYGEILRDHGFNPTPVWSVVGGPLANLVPAGSARGIVLLCLLDPLLLAVMFALIAWAFGLETMLLAMLYVCVFFGADFGWMGGAFLRHVWLLGLVGSVCCLARGHAALGGGLLAVATLLRIFPAAFLWGLAGTAVWDFARRRRWPSVQVRAFAGFAVTAIALGAATLSLPRGTAHWREFRANMERHLEHTAYNTIGLTEILAYRGPAKPTTPEAAADDLGRRASLRKAQLLFALPLVLLGVALLARTQDRPGAMALGAALPLFVGLNLAAYYWMFLLALLIAMRDRPRIVALMFAAEAVSHALLLFEDRQVAVFFYRNLVVFYLLAAVYVESAAGAASPDDVPRGAR
jgi:hypothetical protein